MEDLFSKMTDVDIEKFKKDISNILKGGEE